jgi:hypothetical protein
MITQFSALIVTGIILYQQYPRKKLIIFLDQIQRLYKKLRNTTVSWERCIGVRRFQNLDRESLSPPFLSLSFSLSLSLTHIASVSSSKVHIWLPSDRMGGWFLWIRWGKKTFFCQTKIKQKSYTFSEQRHASLILI